MTALLHERTEIRRAAVARLREELRGVEVLDSRAIPVSESALPAVSVYTLDEEIAEESRHSAPRRFERAISLRVECAVYAPEDVAGELDSLCLLVENALTRDETLGGLSADLYLTKTEIEFPDPGQALLGAAILTFIVEYDTELPRDSLDGLDNFNELFTRWQTRREQAETDQPRDMLTDIYEGVIDG